MLIIPIICVQMLLQLMIRSYVFVSMTAHSTRHLIRYTTFVHKVLRLSLQKKTTLFPELPNIYISRDTKPVSGLYGQEIVSTRAFLREALKPVTFITRTLVRRCYCRVWVQPCSAAFRSEDGIHSPRFASEQGASCLTQRRSGSWEHETNPFVRPADQLLTRPSLVGGDCTLPNMKHPKCIFGNRWTKLKRQGHGMTVIQF
jgi:hypothetical protein